MWRNPKYKNEETISNSDKCYCDSRDRGELGATWELMEMPLGGGMRLESK